MYQLLVRPIFINLTTQFARNTLVAIKSLTCGNWRAIMLGVSIFALICVPVFSVKVQIDGTIDLGPTWNYQYKMESNQAIPYTAILREQISTTRKQSWKDKVQVSLYMDEGRSSSQEERVTKFANHHRPKGIYKSPHSVKDDTKINDFAFHVYKQTLKVFDEIKKKMDPGMAFRVDMLTKSYDEKFRDFINETSRQKIKTRLGTQRVIFNTLDTSNRLLNRLINYFIGDIQKDGLLRTNEVAINVFQKEVDRASNLESLHVCSKFGICRSSREFSDFMIDYFTIIIMSDDKKIKIALDAFTEVVKYKNWNKIMKPKVRKEFLLFIEKIEAKNAVAAKAIFAIAKNLFAFRNQPLNVMSEGPHINKTVAIFEVIDELDRSLPANEDNMLEWADLKNSLQEWTLDKRQDIVEIMQGLVNHIQKKGIDRMDAGSLRNLNDKFDIIFSRR